MSWYPVRRSDIGPNALRRGQIDQVDVYRSPRHTNQSGEERTSGWLGTTNDVDRQALGEFDTVEEMADVIEAELGTDIDRDALRSWCEAEQPDVYTVQRMQPALADVIAAAHHLGTAIYTRANEEKTVRPIGVDCDVDLSRAAVAYACDLAEYQAIDIAGGWGISTVAPVLLNADGVIVAVIVGDEDEPEWDELWDAPEYRESDVFAAVECDGELPREDVQAITTESLWDGHNHVSFVPQRCEEYCQDEDSELYDWGRIVYDHNDDGSRIVRETQIDPEWVCLGWEDCGSTAGAADDDALTPDEFAVFREMDHEFDVAEFSMEAYDTFALFARCSDVEAIRAAIDEQE